MIMNLICFVDDDEAKKDDVDGAEGQTVGQGSAEGVLPVLMEQRLLCVGVTTQICPFFNEHHF